MKLWNAKKILIAVLIMAVLLKLVSAVNVGIVVTYPNGTDFKQCVGVNTNANGYEVLNKADLGIGWSEAGIYGHAFCKIGGVGDEVSGTGCQWGATDYWGFFIVNNNAWGYMHVGVDTPGN